MLTKLKKQIQQMLSIEARAAHKLGLTPNKVTIIGFALSISAALAYALTTTQQPLWLLVAVVLLMASGFCDTLDGILARTYHQATSFGGFLDSLLDRYADVLVLAGVVVSGASVIINPTFSLIVALAAIASSFMVSYSRARAEAAGVKMESVGIAERAERIIILAVASLAAIFWMPALSIGILLIAVLATVTVVQRGLHAYRELRKKEDGSRSQVKLVVGA
jgi:archaetidylinositol phosphate synthase